jgi:hypothetical protein
VKFLSLTQLDLLRLFETATPLELRTHAEKVKAAFLLDQAVG